MKLLNLLILGDCNVGKTSIVSSYVGTKSAISETIGFDIFMCNDIKFYDMSGHTRFSYVLNKYILPDATQIDGLIIVYDITDRDTFDNIQYWLKYARSIIGIIDVPVMIFGNKTDQDNLRCVTQKDVDKYVLSNCNCLHTESNTNDHVGIKQKINNYVMLLNGAGNSNFILNNNGITQDKLKKCVIY